MEINKTNYIKLIIMKTKQKQENKNLEKFSITKQEALSLEGGLSNLKASQVLRNKQRKSISPVFTGLFSYATKHKFTPKNLPKDANLNDTFVNYDANVLILGCSKKIL